MKKLILTILLCLCFIPKSEALTKLSVSGTHFLQDAGSNPVFLMPEDFWNLQTLTPARQATYFNNLRAMGFNCVLGYAFTVGWDEVNQEADWDGEVALTGGDITQPNATFFTHLKTTIDLADSYGLYFGLIVFWREWLDDFTDAQLDTFGEWLGGQLASYDNLLWLIVGEVTSAYETDTCALTIGTDGSGGIVAGDTGNHLIIIHCGYQTTTRVQTSGWADNTFIDVWTGQTASHDLQDLDTCYTLIKADYDANSKPTIDLESGYEAIPDDIGVGNPRWNAQHIRTAAWLSVMAGGCGVAYGGLDIFYGDGGGVDSQYATIEQAIAAYRGRKQLMYLRDIIEERGTNDRVPRQEIITDAGTSEGSGTSRIACQLFGSGKSIVCYNANGRSMVVDMTELSGASNTAYWANPRNFHGTVIASGLGNAGTQNFTPPAAGCDWVLIIDDEAQGYSAP